MKKIILSLLILISSLIAELKNEYLTQELLDTKIPIVDIRTKGEWQQTGILKNSIPIEFFNQKGQYNIPLFLDTLNKKVDTKKPFALICRTGSRTKMVASYLSDTYNYKVTNIKGGIIMSVMDPNNKNIIPYK
ncbi:rhodanese-like domain-containing protein [Sulfurimonas sp. SAG-AH-194-I05]|nr:rhodanese-like domain-containing protein [Sulfurimonas sp. SAG-AH-194-I05]MDF1874483.1 rhodanese-like domain-containing protein [Sulfurimonas sp. SAG-AH-194-I05]